jgi:hypothetical protein
VNVKYAIAYAVYGITGPFHVVMGRNTVVESEHSQEAQNLFLIELFSFTFD